ncbi:hypothetical protein [Chelativorans alearense]|uniref:hypothetical protein n=1 Tax=Chelativorans alearense TaxID=2681495 RepID=UPI0013D8AB35|nr:hypothetical protein [Chelativorans alearense]
MTTLRDAEGITEERYIEAGEPVRTHFIADGRIFHARLVPASRRRNSPVAFDNAKREARAWS